MKPTILLNIGNTHTQETVVTGPELGPVRRTDTAAFLESAGRDGYLGTEPGLACLAACVVPRVAQGLRQAWGSARVRFLTVDMVAGLDFTGVDTTTLGADRIANAVAAVAAVAPPLIVLDCGTALTTVVVDAGRRFRGGAIAPGRRLLRLALSRHTGQLPDVPLQDARPGPIGRCTHGAILAGVDLGVLGTVRELLARSSQELGGTPCPVLVTGGDAEYFLQHLGANLPGLQRAARDLTLRGLACVAAMSRGRKASAGRS